MTQARLNTDTPTFEMPQRKRLEYVPGQYFVRVHPEAVRPYLDVPVRVRRAAHALTLTAEAAESIPQAVVEPLDYLRENAP
jgi:hypothetical protein